SDRDLLVAVDWTSLQVQVDGRLDLSELTAELAQAALSDLQLWLQPAGVLRAPSGTAEDKQARLDLNDNDDRDSAVDPSRTHARIRPKQRRPSRHPATVKILVGVSIAVVVGTLGAICFAPPKRSQSAPHAVVDVNPKHATDQRKNAPEEVVRYPELDLSSSVPSVPPVPSSVPLLEALTDLEPSPSSLSTLSPSLSPGLSPRLSVTEASDAQTPDGKTPDALGTNSAIGVDGTSSAKAADVTSTDSSRGSSARAAVTSRMVEGQAGVTDVMLQVTQSLEQAQRAAEQPTLPSTETVSTAESTQAPAPTKPTWVLARDNLYSRYFPPKDQQPKARAYTWSLCIQELEGMVIEPAAAQQLETRSMVQWRIFDAADKSPRACLIVQAMQRGGRDAAVDVLLCGGAEDLPELRVPLGRKWLDPLKLQMQSVTLQSRMVIDQLSNSDLPQELRSQAAQYRKLLGAQIKLSQRLVTVMADLDRLAGLVDGQIMCEAEIVGDSAAEPGQVSEPDQSTDPGKS
ncbi:MAG: hypothetical protein IT423_10320, partial [Pirellulaceae bacterium]|nr:hypothetical protein [Pirellulaceae bacterium]